MVLSNEHGKKIMKEFTVEVTSQSGQSVAGSVSVDPHAFIERFVELPVCDDAARDNDKQEANEDVVSGGENEDVVSGGENEDVVSGGENEDVVTCEWRGERGCCEWRGERGCCEWRGERGCCEWRGE